MRVIDLSHPIEEGMPVYPGTPGPEITPSATLAGEGWSERRVVIHTHTGTHVDAPAHMEAGGATITDLAAGRFAGPAAVVDVSEQPDSPIGLETLQAREEDLSAVRFLLIRTGWDRLWGCRDYFRSFPTLAEPALDWLGRLSLSGVGVDAPSVDDMNSRNFPVHRRLFQLNMVIVENLSGLENLPASGSQFCCFPLKIGGSDGSPVRAVALVE